MKPSLQIWACLLSLAAAVGCGPAQPKANTPSPPAKALATSAQPPSSPSKSSVSDAKPAEGWGDVTGRFVLDGPVPRRPVVTHTKDTEVCGPTGLAVDLIVDKDGGLANVVVMLVQKPGAPKPPIHPSLEKPAGKATLDNVKCLFEPHICVVRAGQPLVLKNSDPVGHNVNAGALRVNEPFNELLAPGNSTEKQFTKTEKLPAVVQCSIHPWMIGYLVVCDDPYVAVSGSDGSFAIKNLPAGSWTLQAWQEKSGYVSQVKLQGTSTEWKRGQFEVTIDSAQPLDLGEIKVSPELFKD